MASSPEATTKKMKMSAGLWLRERTVRDLVREKRRLVEVPYNATLSSTINALVANNTVAVAVAAPPGRYIGAGGSMILESDPATGAVRKHYIGIITMLDVLVHIAGDEPVGSEAEVDLDSRMALPVSSVIGHSLEGLTLWTLNPNTSILDCMETFSKGVHWALVPVENQADNDVAVELGRGRSLIDTFSALDLQSCSIAQLETLLTVSVIEFKERVSEITATTAGTVEKQSQKLITCHYETPLADVIAEAASANVHRVWVVDEQGLLRGFVSLTDVLGAIRNKALTAENELQDAAFTEPSI